MDVLKTRLIDAIELTNSLAANLSSDALKSHNGVAPSNAIGAQFWCVVGARESYARAFKAGAWQGFACSLIDIETPKAVHAALVQSKETMLALLDLPDETLSEARKNILITLLEHEAQHHGQLIRYFYANRIDFSPAFAKRYALEMPSAGK